MNNYAFDTNIYLFLLTIRTIIDASTKIKIKSTDIIKNRIKFPEFYHIDE
jgi:hypothetical protein